MKRGQDRLSGTEKRFLARFFVIFFSLFAAIHFVDLSFLSRAVAQVEFHLLSLAGVHAVLQGELLVAGSTPFLFVVDCTGLVMVVLFAALLHSNELESRRRVRALLLYSPLLLAFNLVRLFATLIVGAFAPPLFWAVHALLWFVDSGVVLLAWHKAAA